MSQTVPIRPEEEIAVFAKGACTQGIPACRMDRVGAQYQVDCGYARWVSNRYNSIIMLIEAANFKIRDRSAQMGPRIIELAAMGDPAAIALVMAWEPYIVASKLMAEDSGEFHVNLASEIEQIEVQQLAMTQQEALDELAA